MTEQILCDYNFHAEVEKEASVVHSVSTDMTSAGVYADRKKVSWRRLPREFGFDMAMPERIMSKRKNYSGILVDSVETVTEDAISKKAKIVVP